MFLRKQGTFRHIKITYVLLDISAEIKPTNIQAFDRIKNAMMELSEREAIEIAEIVEKIVKLKQQKL